MLSVQAASPHPASSAMQHHPALQELAPPCLQASAALQHAITQQPQAGCVTPLQAATVWQTRSKLLEGLSPWGVGGVPV